MAYVSYIQLAERPGALELSQQASPDFGEFVSVKLMDATLRDADRSSWTDEETAQADLALVRIDEAVADADALIDGYLQRGGYNTPLTDVPTLVVQWSRSITRYLLHRGLVTKSGEADPVLRDYNNALKMLQQVANGQLMLGVKQLEASGFGGSPLIKKGQTAMRDALRDF